MFVYTILLFEACAENKKKKINVSFNIISPKNFKDYIVIDTYTKLEGINPETGNKDFYSDGAKWITPYRNSIEKGDTLYKVKGEDFFLIKKKNSTIKIYTLKYNPNGVVDTTSPEIEVIKI